MAFFGSAQGRPLTINLVLNACIECNTSEQAEGKEVFCTDYFHVVNKEILKEHDPALLSIAKQQQFLETV